MVRIKIINHGFHGLTRRKKYKTVEDHMKVPRDEIRYIVDAFLTDAQGDVQENVISATQKAEKVLRWLEHFGEQVAGEVEDE